MPSSANHDRILALLATRFGFVSRDQLDAAMLALGRDKNKSLGDVLRQRGDLKVEELRSLTELVELHLKRHGDDPERSLAALSSVPLTSQLRTSDPSSVVNQATMVQDSGRSADLTGGESDAPAFNGPAAGRYRIIKTLARGGLGEVFVARDVELGRDVALKEIQSRHSHDPTCRSRFVLEAEVTGGLEHPGIVPIYGLGQYADGRPYYAMRLIKGDDLRSALRRFHSEPRTERSAVSGFDSLAFRELLGRFIDVCNAVAYAHSRGVLHRDLKPGNVMLGPYGETLVVDWGLAKVAGSPQREQGSVRDESFLSPQSGSDSSATEAGQALGTPAYMPPEQAAGKWDQLGPASDVYSLGATLYEILTGKVPFESKTLDVVITDVRAGRFSAPRQVLPGVPPALEAVCLKAMARNPADRYATVLELAREIERWLADEPVQAWPEPASVRIRRWMRRHRAAVTAAAALLTTAALALAILYLNSERARSRLAEEQTRTAIERDRAEAERKSAQAVRDFLQNKLLGQTDTLMQAKALVQGGRSAREAELDPKISVLLDRAAAELTPDKIESQFPNQPTVQAEILDTIGETYRGIGKYAAAIDHLQRAYNQRAAVLGPDDADTLRSAHNLGLAYDAMGQRPEAILHFERARDGMIKTLGPEDPETLVVLGNLAWTYRAARRLPESIRLFEQVRDGMIATKGPDHPDSLATLNNLAAAYQDAGNVPESIRILEQVRDRKIATLGADHPATLVTLGNLANAYREAGNLQEAIRVLEQVRDLKSQKMGPDHPSTIVTVATLARSYSAANRPSEALAQFDRALAGLERLRFEHQYAGAILNEAARFFEQLGELEKTESWRRKWLVVLKSSGPESMPVATELTGLGMNLIRQKKYADAEAVLRESLAIREKTEPGSWLTANTRSLLGGALAGQQKYADAEPLLVQSYVSLKSQIVETPVADAPGSKSTAPLPRERLFEALERLVSLYDAWGKPDESAKWKKELEAMKSAK